MSCVATMKSPIGLILLKSNSSGLTGLYTAEQINKKFQSANLLEFEQNSDCDILQMAMTQLSEYFAGTRQTFDIPLEPEGSDFQKLVWHELRRIGYAETISYQDLAKRIGNPKATRAVGNANGKNPISIIVPCHRVIGSSGNLTGYAGGIECKKQLLDMERKWAGKGSNRQLILL